MTENMSDPLAASSMLLAVVALVYSAWSPAIQAALAISFNRVVADRADQRRQVILTFWGQAVPIFVAAWGAFAVFAKRAIDILCVAIHWSSTDTYDDVKAAFVVTEGVVLMIAVAITVQAIMLARKWVASHR